MATVPSLLAPALLLTAGIGIRYLGRSELVVGVATPVVNPKLTAEFIGDFVVVIGLATLMLTLLDLSVGLPEPVWLGFGVAIVLAVLTLPALAGRYLEWRLRRAGDS